MTLPRHLFILKPSSIAGVGVFSLQDIKAGESVDDLFDQGEDVRLMNPETVPLALRDHGVKQPDGTYSYAENLNRMSVGWYMNHSEDANVRSVNDGDTLFVAVKDIRAGEEITIDYRTLEEDFKGYVPIAMPPRIGVDKNVPLPGRFAMLTYPFEEMQVGDSFLAPAHTVRARFYTIVAEAKKRLGWEFTVKRTPEGYRCWRVA